MMFIENEKKETSEITIKGLEQVSGGASSREVRCPRCNQIICYYNPNDPSDTAWAERMKSNHVSGCSGSNTGHH